MTHETWRIGHCELRFLPLRLLLKKFVVCLTFYTSDLDTDQLQLKLTANGTASYAEQVALMRRGDVWRVVGCVGKYPTVRYYAAAAIRSRCRLTDPQSAPSAAR